MIGKRAAQPSLFDVGNVHPVRFHPGPFEVKLALPVLLQTRAGRSIRCTMRARTWSVPRWEGHRPR